MQQRIEVLAPGFGSRVMTRRVLGPRELEQRNANLVGGAINGGTSQLHQELFFRPVPGMLGRPETGIRGLYLGSASAHPGGGVHGSAGANAARAAMLHDRSPAHHRPRRRALAYMTLASLWQDRHARPAPAAESAIDGTTEVAIVGGGITGLTAARPARPSGQGGDPDRGTAASAPAPPAAARRR